MKEPTVEQISTRAYELWELAGKPRAGMRSSISGPNKSCRKNSSSNHLAHYRVSNHRLDTGRWSGLPVQLSLHTTPTCLAILLRQMTSQHQNV
jgi:hypothetical protein